MEEVKQVPRCHFCGEPNHGVSDPNLVRYCRSCTEIRCFVRYAICPDGRFTSTNDGLHETFVPKLETEEQRTQREKEGMIVRDLGIIAAKIKRADYANFAAHRKQAIQILLDSIMCTVRGDEAVYFGNAIKKMMEDFNLNILKTQRGE